MKNKNLKVKTKSFPVGTGILGILGYFLGVPFMYFFSIYMFIHRDRDSINLFASSYAFAAFGTALLSVLLIAFFPKFRQLWMWIIVMGFGSTVIFFTGFILWPSVLEGLTFGGVLIALFFSFCSLAILASIVVTIVKNKGKWQLQYMFDDKKVKNPKREKK